MAVVRVRIVAQNDPSLKKTILDYVGMVGKADKAIVQSSTRAASERKRGTESAYRQSARAEVDLTATVTREEAKRAREQERNVKNLARIKDRSMANFQRDDERASRASVVRAKAIGREAVQTFASVGKAAIGLTLGAGRAIGVDTSATSIISKGVGFEKAIVNAANSGALAKGHGATKDEIGSARGAVVSAADKTFTDVNQMAEALAAFTSKTGDIDAGKASLEMFGKIARATGSDIVDIADAAGHISNSLGNAPDKAKLLEESLRVVASQGALGSVEIKDLASQMGKFSSKAFMFEGDRQGNIATLGALAQMAMKGGAASAPEAANSAGNFARDLTKSKTMESFDKAGINLFADKERTKLRNAEDIIVDVLKNTGGSLDEMANLFKNDSSGKSIKGFASIYQDAGGGEAGIAAVRGEFKRLKQSSSQADIEKSFQNSAGTTEAKAVAFNNKMQATGATLLESIMPALQEAAPSFISLAQSAARLAPAFASVASWAAGNPWAAIVAALGASLLKAGIANVIKDSITKLMTGGGGPGGPGGVPGAGGKALPVLAAGAAGFLGTQALLDMNSKENERVNNSTAQLEMDAFASSNDASRGDKNALLRLFGQINQMKDLASYSGPSAPVQNKEGWNQNIKSLEAERDAAMNKLPLSAQAEIMIAGLTGTRLPKDSSSEGASPNTGDGAAKSATILLAGAEALKNAGLAEAAAALSSAAAALQAAAAAGPPKDGTTR